MNSLAHSILKLSMRWTPSLTHPNDSTSGERNCSHSAWGPPITNSSLSTQAKHIPDPKDLVLQVQTPQICAYNFLSLGDTKQTNSNSTYKPDFSPFSLKPWLFAQASAFVSLKLNYLAWASVIQWLSVTSRLGEVSSPKQGHLSPKTTILSPKLRCKQHTYIFCNFSLRRDLLA